MWTMRIVKSDCSRNKGSLKALGPAAHRAETIRSIAPLSRQSHMRWEPGFTEDGLHRPPHAPPAALPPQCPVTDHPCPPTTDPSLGQLVQLVTVWQQSDCLSREQHKKTTANAIILIINNNAASVWMSSEHVGHADGGYNPTFGGMPFGSRTTITCFHPDHNQWLTFLWHVNTLCVILFIQRSKPLILVEFCVGCQSVTNSCPLGNIHPSIHLLNPLPPTLRVC